MKKILKLLFIIFGIYIIGCGIYWGYFNISEKMKINKLNNERINSKTLSEYINSHDFYHMVTINGNDEPEYYLSFVAQNIEFDLSKDKNILYYNHEFISEYGFKGILILDDYTIYETAFNNEKSYSNGKKYKQIETNIEIKRMQIHYNEPYFVSKDNKYYKINKNSKTLEEIEYIRDNYLAYSTLQDESIKKIIGFYNKLEGRNYLVLKNDGQVYIQQYEDDNKLIKEEIFLSNKEYGNIIDLEYMYSPLTKENSITKILSDKGLYYLKQTNESECIDTNPIYKIIESEIYKKYKEDIYFINKDYILTKDNNIINTETICRDLDKDVK